MNQVFGGVIQSESEAAFCPVLLTAIYAKTVCFQCIVLYAVEVTRTRLNLRRRSAFSERTTVFPPVLVGRPTHVNNNPRAHV